MPSQHTPCKRSGLRIQHARPVALSLTLLCAAMHTAFAQINVATEAQYNTALQAGQNIGITGAGFPISKKPENPIGADLGIEGEVSNGRLLTTLRGNSNAWYAFSNDGSAYSLTYLNNIVIDGFGNSAIRNETPSARNLNISNGHLQNNTNNMDGGGAVVAWKMGIVADSIFTGNAATGDGGAIHANSIGRVDTVRFVDNIGRQGGAIYASEIPGLSDVSISNIRRSVFIGNRTHANTANASAHGGALHVGGTLDISDNVFLNNHAQGGAAAGGLGGAIYHLNTGVTTNTVYIRGLDTRFLFYGNLHNPSNTGDTPNAIFLDNSAPDDGNARNTRLRIRNGFSAPVVMLDPIGANPTMSTEINKDASGSWYLGGNTVLDGHSGWSIYDAPLILTSVDYGEGVVPASIQLNNSKSFFILFRGFEDIAELSDAALAGSGTVKAPKIFLNNGIIAPSTVTNTGILAHPITHNS